MGFLCTFSATFTGPPSGVNYGGRLNTAGLWDAYDPIPPDEEGPELAFEYCIDITESKQYLVGISGDNNVKFYVDGILIVFLDSAVVIPPASASELLLLIIGTYFLLH
jgi:hypothetical protein